MKTRRIWALAAPVAALSVTFGAAPSAEAQGAPPAEARAETSVAAEIIILHATNDGTGIDPKIGKMPELGKPPFSSYNSYKLLERSKAQLSQGKAAETKLPNGRTISTTLKEVTPPKKKGDAKRYVVSASIQKADGKSFLPLLEVNARAGETFFVAGQSHKGGILVIGIKVAP